MLKNKKRIVARALAAALAFSTVFGISAPTDVYAATKTVTVSTQKDLNAALKDNKIKKIIIKSPSKKSFTIKKGSYKKKTLIVNGAKLNVTNAGKFQSITIKDALKYTEAAKNNAVKVTDDKLSLVIESNAVVRSVELAKTGAKDSLVVDGTLKALNITKKSDVTLKGDTQKAVPVTVNAKDSTVSSQIKVKIETSVDLKAEFGAGAEGSKITCAADGIKLDVTNNSGASVWITDKTGNITEVKAGESFNNKDGADKGDSDKDTGKDDKKDDQTSSTGGGGSTGGGSSSGGSSNAGSSTISGSTFAATIASVSKNDSQNAYIVDLDKNVTGDVNATFSQAGELIINFGNHTISGSFKIEAPNADFIYFNDNGIGVNGATVTGDFEVNAPKAHVENQVSVNGTTKIHEVSGSTYWMFDKSARFEVYGSGKIQFANNVVNPPKVDIKTEKTVTLAGAIDKVEVQVDAAKLDIAQDTAIGEVIIPEGKKDTVISGNGKIETIDASAPVTVYANVDHAVVNNDAAEIAVTGSAVVSNVTVASDVKNVKVSGKVTAIDVSNAGNDIVITSDSNAKIIVKDEEQANAIISNEANAGIKDQVVYVTGISVTYADGFSSSIALPVGEELDLDDYKLTVTDSKQGSVTIPVTKAMLKDANYVLTAAGKAAVYVTYAGKEELLTTITYMDKDVVTLTSTVGQKEIMVNGDGDYFDAYTIGVEYFDNNGLANVIKATSKYGMDIRFQYKPLKDDGDDSWTEGLPTTAGNYVIYAYTSDSEQCFGGAAAIWIFSSADKDYFVFDESKIPSDIASDVTVSNVNNNVPSSNWPVELASLRFGKDSFTQAKLKSILDSAVSTHNKAQITYKYFAQGAVGSACVRDGLPAVPGAYCVRLNGTDQWGNEASANIYVNCEGVQFAVVNATISGRELRVVTDEAFSVNPDFVDYVRYRSTITQGTGDKVTVELREGCMDQCDIIEIPQGTAYAISIQSGSKQLSISDCRIIAVKELVVSSDGWHETGDVYGGSDWPTEKGRYRIVVCVTEDTADNTCETWCSFCIEIK